MYIYGSQRGKRNKIKSGLYMHGPSYLGMDAVRFVLSIYMVLDRFFRTPCRPCAPIGCKFENKGKGRASRCGFGTNMGAASEGFVLNFASVLSRLSFTTYY